VDGGASGSGALTGRVPASPGRGWSARVGDALLDLLLPRHCVVCSGAVERGRADVICGRCWAALPLLPHPRCARCDHPLVVGDLPAPYAPGPRRCRWCDVLPPYVRAVRSVCWAPEGTGGGVVHALKYAGWTAAAAGMAARMAALPLPEDAVRERRALVPVPLAEARRRERGFNQSALLAAAMGLRWQLPCWADVLRRTRATPSQTRLTPGERLRNVARAFQADAARRPELRGAHVVLIDDVVTTAATLNACAAALIDGGARIVSYVTFGRARS
jgi:ComF family protein